MNSDSLRIPSYSITIFQYVERKLCPSPATMQRSIHQASTQLGYPAQIKRKKAVPVKPRLAPTQINSSINAGYLPQYSSSGTKAKVWTTRVPSFGFLYCFVNHILQGFGQHLGFRISDRLCFAGTALHFQIRTLLEQGYNNYNPGTELGPLVEQLVAENPTSLPAPAVEGGMLGQGVWHVRKLTCIFMNKNVYMGSCAPT